MSRLKHKVEKLIHSKHMLWSVALASFLESTLIPVPLEAVLIPLMQAKRERLWAIAAMATLGCLVGALCGYGLGYFLYEALQGYLIEYLTTAEQLSQVKAQMQAQGFWYVLSLGIVPVPFQIAMLAAGAVSFSLGLFILATLIARSIRYFGLALLVKLAGNQAEELFQRYRYPSIVVLSLGVVLLWWLSQ